jgi:hypothetical protein
MTFRIAECPTFVHYLGFRTQHNKKLDLLPASSENVEARTQLYSLETANLMIQIIPF